ncbi:non-homologous end joining protein Ku [Actinacidiphila soli]|uniref:non-homologous end joining protein Ku n=1 Tax=Actinacidiphila soli TaxID=2487275 RepID=UPI000FCA27F6|nr:Ku protein [Actinacidiphila soli]
MAPATIAKLSITFGLVSIPVHVHAATQDHDVPLHQVHADDGGRILMKRTCEKCGQEVAYADIARGYQDSAGRTAVLTDADFAELPLPLPSMKMIDVMAFVDTVDIDPVSLSRAYFLAADPASAKPYVLLRNTLTSTGKAAITKVTFRTGSRESLALLRVHDQVLVLQTMHWPDEIRPSVGLAPTGDIEIHSQELQMASSLMETMSEHFDLQTLHDDYQKALDQLVRGRLEGLAVPALDETAPPPEGVVDLMAALQASIDARAAQDEPPTPRKPAKKTPAQSPAKSTEAKKTAVKKPPRRTG